MAENFDFIENDVRPTRRKKMEKAKGQKKSDTSIRNKSCFKGIRKLNKSKQPLSYL